MEFGRKNEADLRAAGVPFVDFRSETSNTHLSVTFECTPSLRGRITPFPHYHDLYVLDFVSTTDGKRFDRDTNLDIYDVGVLGEEEPINTQGTVPERRGTVDIYTLNPGRTVQICRRNDKQVLKTVSFAYSGGKIMPRIEWMLLVPVLYAYFTEVHPGGLIKAPCSPARGQLHRTSCLNSVTISVRLMPNCGTIILPSILSCFRPSPFIDIIQFWIQVVESYISPVGVTCYADQK